MRNAISFCVLACVIAAAIPTTRTLAADPDTQDHSLIEHGRYLATLADCTACHTRPDGGQPFAGGRPIETPFGIIVSANITPDPETGIGNWTDEQFDKAVRHGIRADGRRLYPAMPFTFYAKMSRDDVKAIRAYLATIPPVRNPVVSDQLPFPFDIRMSMIAWDTLFFRDGEFKPDSNKSPEWNRGAYLVAGPGHCGACHTPKNFLGADKRSQALQGGQVQGWFAPDITNDEVHGLGSMSVNDIVTLLKTGHNRLATVTGPMAEEVENASTHFKDDDLKAIASYLKSLPGDGGSKEKPLDQSDARMVAGKAIFHDTCAACHGLDGEGVANLFPALAEAPTVRSKDPTSAIRVILRGARSVGTKAEPTAPAMPSFGWQLRDDQIAAVATYIRNSWGKAATPVSADDVAKQKSDLAPRTE
jgi:mono/diheme cytochrome c family protein